jgi:hypothetical protein
LCLQQIKPEHIGDEVHPGSDGTVAPWNEHLPPAFWHRADRIAEARGPRRRSNRQKQVSLIILIGALLLGASLFASRTRAVISMSSASRPMTSPKVQICSSEYWPAIKTSSKIVRKSFQAPFLLYCTI